MACVCADLGVGLGDDAGVNRDSNLGSSSSLGSLGRVLLSNMWCIEFESEEEDEVEVDAVG